MEFKTTKDMDKYCDRNRESDGFCRLCCSCSGPALSNLAVDHPFPKGKEIYRGGRYGSCEFVVSKN